MSLFNEKEIMNSDCFIEMIFKTENRKQTNKTGEEAHNDF